MVPPVVDFSPRIFIHAKIEALNRTYFDFSAILSRTDGRVPKIGVAGIPAGARKGAAVP